MKHPSFRMLPPNGGLFSITTLGLLQLLRAWPPKLILQVQSKTPTNRSNNTALGLSSRLKMKCVANSASHFGDVGIKFGGGHQNQKFPQSWGLKVQSWTMLGIQTMLTKLCDNIQGASPELPQDSMTQPTWNR